MAVAKKITVPFANTGDKIEIPVETQSNGSVSREKGFTEHYELEYDNPNAKDIERTVFNAIEHTQDSAIAEIQQYGVAQFSNENDYKYPKGAAVYYDGQIYVSLKDDNSSLPTTKDWQKIYAGDLPIASLTQKGITQLTNTIDISEDKAATPKGVLGYVQAELLKTVPVGTISLWGGEFAPEGYLLSRGQSFSASQYPKLAVLFPSLKLPDFRGVVPRGLDDTRGFDPGRTLLSYQEDATQKVVGNFAMSGFDPSIAVNPTGPFSIDRLGGTGTTGSTYAAYRATFDNSKVIRTANEERMKNIAMNFIIKAG